jgi:deazaflavin-dependent oxidoreductase (nitroreductase family)
MKIPNKVRYLNKKFTNRLMIRIAGKKGSPILLIEHVGRASGKVYHTPIMAARYDSGFMFALTYGPGVDWYKNVLVARRAKLTFNGKEYLLIDPEDVSSSVGQLAFAAPKSNILRIIGIEDFFFMKVAAELES